MIAVDIYVDFEEMVQIDRNDARNRKVIREESKVRSPASERFKGTQGIKLDIKDKRQDEDTDPKKLNDNIELKYR